ncbi:MAG: iron-sulfur cluster assembly accessory protein [Thiotrichaceae bacterium]|nr:iron-sulfur cluster assembly accessory protein [Thiotrichaceae bacterium]
MIKLTEDAANQIIAQIKASGDTTDPLRIAVTKHEKFKGFQYLMGFDTAHDNDSVFESRGVQMVVNSDFSDVVNGMEIDYVEVEGEESQFIFKNPNDPTHKAPTE